MYINMRIAVKVKASAKTAKVEKLPNGSLLVWVKEKPQEGKANYAVRETLADYFGIPRSRVTLVSGERSKIKLFEIT